MYIQKNSGECLQHFEKSGGSFFLMRNIHLVLVKAPYECIAGIIGRCLRSRDDNARGDAECVIDS